MKKFAPTFELFCNTHSTTENFFQNFELCPIQKKCLYNALIKVVGTDKNHQLKQSHQLKPLIEKLSWEMQYYPNRPITEFIDTQDNLSNEEFIVLKMVLTPNNEIFNNMPRSTDESQKNQQELNIKEAIIKAIKISKSEQL